MTKSRRTKVFCAPRGTYSLVTTRERWKCATLSCAHFRDWKWNFLSLLQRNGAETQLHWAVYLTEGHRVPAMGRQEVQLRFFLPLFSLHFTAVLAKKRIKSGNEGCKAPGSFLPRQSHSAGSFTLSLWAVEARMRNSCNSACQPFQAECP